MKTFKLVGRLVRLLFVLLALFLLTGPHPILTPREELVHFDDLGDPGAQGSQGTWCPKEGCLTLASWDTLASPPLRFPLALAYTYNPEWRPVAWEAASRATLITVSSDEPAPGAAGAYMAVINTIIIDRSILNQPPDVQAMIVSHEIAHASLLTALSQVQLPVQPDTCFAEEARAIAWQLSTWLRVPHSEQSGQRTAWSESADVLLGYWRANRLEEAIRQIPGYQQECQAGMSGKSTWKPKTGQ